MIKVLLALVICFSSPVLMAQNDKDMTLKYGPRRQISTIVYMGLAGAVLGLSTLSFYGRPQDHLTNIPIGFGVGVIIGTIYMTYQAATNPSEFYRAQQYQPNFRYDKTLDITSVADMHYVQPPPSFNYQWEF
jgi:hypothetical protein